MKRATSVLALLIVIFSFPFLVRPASVLPMEGTWKINGKASVGASIPGLIQLNATFLKNKEITDTLTFQDGTLYSRALGPVGHYTSGSPAIDIDGLVETLRESIASRLPEGASLAFTTATLNMKAGSATSAAGTLVLVLNARSTSKTATLKNATFTISCTFTGEKQATADPASLSGASDAMGVIADYLAKKAVNPAIALMDSGSIQNNLRNAIGNK
ncbi:MAG: hypothetical protein LLG06_13715 [Desulfobacteraceae bacterium]|nr:hypothetical protein [Desulfobacteraceae bacterium]